MAAKKCLAAILSPMGVTPNAFPMCLSRRELRRFCSRRRGCRFFRNHGLRRGQTLVLQRLPQQRGAAAAWPSGADSAPDVAASAASSEAAGAAPSAGAAGFSGLGGLGSGFLAVSRRPVANSMTCPWWISQWRSAFSAFISGDSSTTGCGAGVSAAGAVAAAASVAAGATGAGSGCRSRGRRSQRGFRNQGFHQLAAGAFLRRVDEVNNASDSFGNRAWLPSPNSADGPRKRGSRSG